MSAASRSRRPRVMFLGLRGIGGVQGGVETHVSELVRHLPYPREEIEVIGRRPYRPLGTHSDPTLPIVRWLPTWRNPLLEAIFHTFIGVLYAAIRRPALLHIHAIGPNVVTPIARLMGLRVVSTHHGEDYWREKWGRFGRIVLRFGERQAVCRANACISISPIVTQSLRARFQQNVTFIPNGITAMPYAPPGDTLARLGLEPNRYVLNVARLVPEKRHIDLIDAFLEAGVPDMKLLLVGGADHDGAYVRSIRARVAERPEIVLAGHLSGAPLAEVFWNASLFALPSSHEGLPIALLEAMSCGLPILVSDLPVYSKMGIPKNCIFPLRDVTSLTRALQSALSNTTTRADWSKLLGPYQWPKIANETAKLYAEVLTASSR